MLCSLALVQGLMFIISRWSGWLRDEKENTEQESSLSNADWLLEMFDKIEEKMLSADTTCTKITRNVQRWTHLFVTDVVSGIVHLFATDVVSQS